MNNPHPATCTPAELLGFREMGTLDVRPKFQRRSVWTLQQRSYLIDTILRMMPVPSIYFRNIYVPKKKKLMRQVIDGQQRILAVLDFVDDKYALSRTLENDDGTAPDYAGEKFSALSKKQQNTIMSFTFSYQAFEGINNEEVYEIFRRMNTYSSPLTPQELRHGQYFGYFSRTCETLAKEHLKFWENNRIIKSKDITRMGEVEFTASLLATQIDGFFDKNKGVDKLYAELDDKFPDREQHRKRFRTTIDQIVEALGDSLLGSQFRRPALFHSLFCAVYHRMYGIPNMDPLWSKKTPKKPLTTAERALLAATASHLSEVIARAREHVAALSERHKKGALRAEPPKGVPYAPRHHSFVVASLGGTTGALARETRMKTIYTETFD